MNWAELSWNGENDRQQRRSAKPPNRELVEIITCPTCKGRQVERHSVVGPVSHWKCTAGKGCPRWKETADTGTQGRGQIA